jgi:two-component sensor histidine kinase/Tfp pilus assembly protein PilF
MLTVPAICLSQNKKIDSIKILIADYEKKHGEKTVSISDSVRAGLYNKLSSAYDYELPDVGIRQAEKALQISKKIDYQKGMADAYFQISRIAGRKGNPELAKKNIQKALAIYIALNANPKIADCYNNLAIFYAQKGNYPEATQYFLKALKYYEKFADNSLIAGTYGNMGTLYNIQGKTNEALKCYLKALKLIEHLDKNNIQFSGIYLSLGSIYLERKEIEQALMMLDKANQVAIANKNVYMKAIVGQNLGKCYEKRKDYDKALDHYLKANLLFGEMQNTDGVSTTNLDIGFCHHKMGENKKALQFIKEAVKQLEGKNLDSQKTGYRYLSDVYASMKDYKLAFENYLIYKKLNDSLFDSEKEKKITQLQMQYEFDKIQDETKQAQREKILQMNEETKKERSIKYIVMIALLGVSVLGLGVFTNLKKNQRQKVIIAEQKKTVEEQNAVIKQSLAEKETLLREIHHRVKNNLQIISSLLNIQSQHIVDENVLSSIQEGQSRVQAMSLIHQNLYQSEHLSNVDIENYLRELTAYLSEMFVGSQKSIQVEVEASKIQFDIDTAIPLGLIVNELVSNAYKYAFDKRDSGKIKIKIKAINAIDYELDVNDDGNGLPAGFDPKNSRSLGLKLVSILSRQLRGSMSFNSDQGTSFTVRFKDVKSYQSSI